MKSRVLAISFFISALLLIIQCTGNNPLNSPNTPSSGQSWYFLNPIPTGNALLDVKFSSDNTVWAVGSSATLLKSVDGGKSWSLKPELPTTAFCLFFTDYLTGWAVGGAGMIVKTKNGGNSWQEQKSGVSSILYSVHFIDSDHGWAAGLSGNIIRTVDGGETWLVVSTNPGYVLRDIEFADENDGWAVGHSYTSWPVDVVMHSKDGGETWSRVDVGIPDDLGEPDPQYWDDVSAQLNAVALDGNGAITIVGFAYQGGLLGGVVVQSKDGGKSWAVELTNHEYSDVLYVTDEGKSSRKLIGDFQNRFMDSGDVEDPVILKSTIPNSMDFSDSKHGCAVGYAGWIFLTEDGGQTWNDINNSFRSSIEDIQFIDSVRGWATSSDGLIYTEDGGDFWVKSTSSATSQVCFISESVGFASSFDGNIDKTIDGGITWARVFNHLESSIYAMFFYDSLIGWTCGMPYIMHTSDGGKSWTQQWLERDGTQLWGMSFIDSLHGWVVGHNGRVLQTNDGGRNWTKQIVPLTHYHDVFFIDTLKGWAAGHSSQMLFTTDGGINWEFANVPGPFFGVNSIVFIDSLNGWAVGRGGNIIHSTDGGKNWNFQKSPANSDLYTLWVHDSNKIWAAGWFGTLIHTTNGGR